MGLFVWLVQQGPPRKKRAVRYADPGLVAYYWDGGAPKKHVVANISSTGAHVHTKELWCVGTIVTLTLQKAGDGENMSGAPSITLPCRVARHGQDGIGFNFMLQREQDRRAFMRFMRRAVKLGKGSTEGQALVEFALMVPLLFFLIVLAMNFGGWLYSWIQIGNGVRTAADYASLGVSSAGDPATATGTTLVNLINADLAKLPNTTTSNPSVYICQNDGTNITALTGTCPSGANAPVADPEAPTYVAVTVDITFTYTPFFSTFSFPTLGIGLPTIPSTIHKRAVMRILN